ncbi:MULTISPECIES: hypothetical protein [unclassified Moraxella]
MQDNSMILVEIFLGILRFTIALIGMLVVGIILFPIFWYGLLALFEM